jgi:hypothetical protein
MEHFDRERVRADLNLLVHEPARHRVAVMLELDVTVEIDGRASIRRRQIGPDADVRAPDNRPRQRADVGSCRGAAFGAGYPMLGHARLVKEWREQGFAPQVLDDVVSRNPELFLASIGG